MTKKSTLSPLTATEKERIYQAAGPDALLLRLIGDCALTVEEAATLRWEDVDLDGRKLSVSGRSVPISDETVRLLAEATCQGSYVLPAARSPQTPMSRVVVSRKVRQTLDKAGFPDLDASLLRTLRILELLETCSIEEVARVTGYEVRSLRVLWSRYHETPLPTRPRKPAVSPDEDALQAALEREGGHPCRPCRPAELAGRIDGERHAGADLEGHCPDS